MSVKGSFTVLFAATVMMASGCDKASPSESGADGDTNDEETGPSTTGGADSSHHPADGTEAAEAGGDADAAGSDAAGSDLAGSDTAGNDSDTQNTQNTDTQNTVVVRDEGVEVVEGDGTVVTCYETVCDGRLLECGDCVDNDGDGKADARDRECLGPCDNTEGPALISDVGGVTGSTCHVDCYFDYGNGIGTGSDDCWWDHQCDPLEPEKAVCPFDERRVDNEKFCPDDQSERCGEVCLPFTPNGCDCFGCCTFPELAGLGPDGGDGYVWIGAKDAGNIGICTFDDILDAAKCPRCTPIPNCLNDCGLCELCIGKTELPDECYDTPDGEVPELSQCPDGSVPCGLPDQAPCEPGFFCISGCCKPTSPVV